MICWGFALRPMPLPTLCSYNLRSDLLYHCIHMLISTQICSFTQSPLRQNSRRERQERRVKTPRSVSKPLVSSRVTRLRAQRHRGRRHSSSRSSIAVHALRFLRRWRGRRLPRYRRRELWRRTLLYRRLTLNRRKRCWWLLISLRRLRLPLLLTLLSFEGSVFVQELLEAAFNLVLLVEGVGALAGGGDCVGVFLAEGIG